MNKKAFTLAEIMIVLTIIGVITAILLPIAFQSAPDENVMKFKKGNNTLGNVIRELVNSDNYYLDGNLGIRANGNYVDGTHDGDYTYFCQSFADLLNVKDLNCKETGAVYEESFYQVGASVKEDLDNLCKKATTGSEIITSDNITYFQVNPKMPFGVKWVDASEELKTNCQNPDFYSSHTDNCETTLLFAASNSSVNDDNGFGAVYKIFCMDVDGIDKGEDPFGYGIRADGKIIMGARADEWMNKSVQQGD